MLIMKKIKLTTLFVLRTLKAFAANPWGMPGFFHHWSQYNKKAGEGWRAQGRDIHPVLNETDAQAGRARGHYFLQDLWAAQQVFNARPLSHVDVGSRVDGFVAQVACFMRLEYVDLRPLDVGITNIQSREGSILALPYTDSSLVSISCLHVLEHIGLSRYGDELDPLGWQKGLKELVRVLKPGGMLLLSVPVGKQRVCFNAHRVFDPQTIIDNLSRVKLKEYHLIPNDMAKSWEDDPGYAKSRESDYGCGLFKFEKTM